MRQTPQVPTSFACIAIMMLLVTTNVEAQTTKPSERRSLEGTVVSPDAKPVAARRCFYTAIELGAGLSHDGLGHHRRRRDVSHRFRFDL